MTYTDHTPRSVTLADLAPGAWARIVHIDTDSPLYSRMSDMGLCTGVPIHCERKSLFGDPAAYRIMGTIHGTVAASAIALRQCDAAYVLVDPISQSELEEGEVGKPWA